MRHFLVEIKASTDCVLVTQPQLKALDEAEQIAKFSYLPQRLYNKYRKEYPKIKNTSKLNISMLWDYN